jgi:hypothetical protein
MKTVNQGTPNRAESPLIINVGHRPTRQNTPANRAESPLITNIGHRPTRQNQHPNH